MIYQPTFDQDEDVLMLNPDPEFAAFDDDEDDFDDDEVDFEEIDPGADAGFGADDLDDFDEDDLDEDLDDDIEDDLDDDSME